MLYFILSTTTSLSLYFFSHWMKAHHSIFKWKKIVWKWLLGSVFPAEKFIYMDRTIWFFWAGLSEFCLFFFFFCLLISKSTCTFSAIYLSIHVQSIKKKGGVRMGVLISCTVTLKCDMKCDMKTIGKLQNYTRIFFFFTNTPPFNWWWGKLRNVECCPYAHFLHSISNFGKVGACSWTK